MKKVNLAETTAATIWHEDIETALLGACLTSLCMGDRQVLIETNTQLQTSDFYAVSHRLIFQAMLDLIEHEHAITPFIIAHHFEEQGRVDAQQLLDLMLLLLTVPCLPQNCASYANIVRNDALRRSVRLFAQDLSHQADNPRLAIKEVVNQAIDQLQRFHPDQVQGLISGEELSGQFIERFKQRYQQEHSSMGLSTGFNELDQKLLGLHPGQLIVLAARPGVGKTTLAMNWILQNMQTHSVLFASIEMSIEQLSDRFAAMLSGVSSQKIRDPAGQLHTHSGLSDHDFDHILAAMQQIQSSKLHLLDQPGLTVNQLTSHARQLARQQPLGLIVVDYLQLLGSSASTYKNDNRTQEVGRQTRALKMLARELNCPVVCISQLSRDCEKRVNKRPVNADLRDSGSIEQDADVVLFIYRDELYHKDSIYKGITELIIGKQREGETGSVLVESCLTKSKFLNLGPQRKAQLQLMQQQQVVSTKNNFQF